MQKTIDNASSSGWRQHPHLYQIHTWAWLDQLSQQAGRNLQLIDVPDTEWDRIQALGFDFVYLLGIWQRSIAGRYLFRTDAKAFRVFDHALPGWTVASVIGSPFSIQDYVPDARLGDWAQLDAVREKLRVRGMRLMLDFVPNHTGPDHVWIAQHPEYFLHGSEADYQQNPAAFHLITYLLSRRDGRQDANRDGCPGGTLRRPIDGHRRHHAGHADRRCARGFCRQQVRHQNPHEAGPRHRSRHFCGDGFAHATQGRKDFSDLRKIRRATHYFLTKSKCVRLSFFHLLGWSEVQSNDISTLPEHDPIPLLSIRATHCSRHRPTAAFPM